MVVSLPTVPARQAGWDPEFAITFRSVLASHRIKIAVSFIAIVESFFKDLSGLFTGTPTITPIWITGRTTTNIGTIRPGLRNQNPPEPPSTMAQLSSSSTKATPGLRIQALILQTSIAATVRPRRHGNKEQPYRLRTKAPKREPIQAHSFLRQLRNLLKRSQKALR